MASGIDRPIFILGPGRAGSTLLGRLLTLHRDVGYFVSWSNVFPRHPWLSVTARFRMPDFEMKGKLFKGYPMPAEAYGIWKHYFKDFWKVSRSACTDQESAERLCEVIRIHLRAQGKTRFLAKLTGPPITTFLKSIFPDAIFVWMDRDPRAVCYSYFLKGWIGVSPELKANLSEDERVARAAQRYLEHYHAIVRESTPHYWLRYEDLLADPVKEITALLSYMQLRPDARMIDLVARWPLSSEANAKWKERLTETQQQILHDMLDEPLRERGYLSAAEGVGQAVS